MGRIEGMEIDKGGIVNNAGIQHVSPVDSFDDDMWDKVIAINLTSCFQTIKHALPHMKANNFGRIVNISSVHGIVASVQKAAYGEFVLV